MHCDTGVFGRAAFDRRSLVQPLWCQPHNAVRGLELFASDGAIAYQPSFTMIFQEDRINCAKDGQALDLRLSNSVLTPTTDRGPNFIPVFCEFERHPLRRPSEEDVRKIVELMQTIESEEGKSAN